MNDEFNKIIDDCKSDLDKIENWIQKNPLDTNTKYLVDYSIIRACGTIEVIFKRIVFDFLSKPAREETRYYLGKQIIESSCNPNTGNMLRMLEQIDTERRNKFDKLIKGSNDKSSLTSLVNLRNTIAHGKTCNSSINDVKKYFDGGLRILDILEGLML